MTQGFPDLFIFPDAQQQAVTSFNFMHTLLESSIHAAYIISEVRKQGKQYVDVEPEAEESWVAKVVEHAHDRDKFLASCTPGRFSNEGHVERRSPRAASYPLKTNDFFRYWESWRRDGHLRGLRLQSADEG
jgi:cyclohexanone monooxygenase